jgi:hypothetical protein
MTVLSHAIGRVSTAAMNGARLFSRRGNHLCKKTSDERGKPRSYRVDRQIGIGSAQYSSAKIQMSK